MAIQAKQLISSDSTSGVTFVTKVVAVTSYLGWQGTTSSSAASDPSDDVDILTKVVRVGRTTVDTANCQATRSCSINVAVSATLFFLKCERRLIPDLVGLRILLAPRIRKNSVSLNHL